ncbi:MAG: hypothetical protein ACYDHM_10220 [Acidiferrobacterales bacterium]
MKSGCAPWGGNSGAYTYHSGFIGHYAEQIVYTRLPRRLEFEATILSVVASLWAYFVPRR